MANFDFITDTRLRSSLREDATELENCMSVKSWKATHVLSGSIIEAVLTDTLITAEYQTKTGTDPLRMDLGKIIAACKDEGYLSQKAVDLCSVIRNYRNLIHPGRLASGSFGLPIAIICIRG